MNLISKAAMSYLRSSYEHLHIETANALALQSGGSPVAGIDGAINFLKNKMFMTVEQEKFATGLSMLISNEGVHPLVAGQGSSRILRKECTGPLLD
jgi:hypothetical protein